MPVRVPMFDDVEALVAHLNSEVQEDHRGDFGPFRDVLCLNVSHIADRATMEGVAIVDAEIYRDMTTVHYEVQYSVFNGCKDMDVTDIWEDAAHGNAEDGEWIFDEWTPQLERSTIDEF